MFLKTISLESVFLLTNYVVTAVGHLPRWGRWGGCSLHFVLLQHLSSAPLWLGFQGPRAHGPFQSLVIHSFTLILVFPPDKDVY